MAQHCSTGEIYLMVMGATGTGKSTFIKKVCDGDGPKIGQGLESCTSSIRSFSFTGPDGAKIHLIDTPGLDDSDGSDLETIQGLAEWLKASSSRNIKLSGVLYLHKIIDNRMSNSSQENLELFQAICGDSCWSATALVTTMWDHVETTTGDTREYELRTEEKYWGSLVKGGAKVLRYHNTKSSALGIINEVTGLNQIIVPKLLQEVAVENRSITETTAFQHLPERYAQERQRLQEKIDKLERFIGNSQGSHLKLEREVTRLENKLRASQDQQYELNRKVIELQRIKKDSARSRVGGIALPAAVAWIGEAIKRQLSDDGVSPNLQSRRIATDTHHLWQEEFPSISSADAAPIRDFEPKRSAVGPSTTTAQTERHPQSVKVNHEESTAINEYSQSPDSLEYGPKKRHSLDQPVTVQEALSRGNKQAMIQFLETHFKDLVDGDYHWVLELDEIGCTLDEIADILLEQSRDAPWIVFESQSVEAVEITIDKHISNCVHHVLGEIRMPVNCENIEVNQSGFQMLVQELCGLAGVSPLSKDRDKWSGTVEFQESNKAFVSYLLPTDANDLRGPHVALVPRLVQVVEKLSNALGRVQMAGLCCDSFTILVQTESDTDIIVMERLYFKLVADLLKSLQDLEISVDPTTQGESVAKLAMALSNILGPVIGDELMPGLVYWMASHLNAVLHYCSLASQLLCLGFLSYSQAHVGPLQPFFLEISMQQVFLLGAREVDSMGFEMIEARFENLSCIGNMLHSPVLVFKHVRPRLGPLISQQATRFNLSASAEDMVDTWGPGQLIVGNDERQIMGVLLGGGVIHATSADENAQFHWSPTSVEQCTYPKYFEPNKHILVGAAVTVNTKCVRNENEWWRRSCRSLQTLGTYRSYWASEERQIGAQAGNFGLVQANVTWRKFQGRTLKQIKLEQADGQLLAFLEDPWGVQVSFCTGVSRRVALREMVADLLPTFATSTLNKEEREIWRELAVEHRVFDYIKKDAESVRQWLHTLPDEHVKYMLFLIRQILQTLRDTGVDRESNQFIVAWPNERDLQKCFKIPCRNESAWLGFLADSEHCATFAYVTTKCLETDRIKCTGSNTCWQNVVPVLETAVFHVPISEASAVLALRHNDVYFLKKMDGLIYVKAQRPVVLTEVVHLLAWQSTSPQGIQARVASLLRVRNDRRQRELRERTALEVIWAEEVAVCTPI